MNHLQQMCCDDVHVVHLEHPQNHQHFLPLLHPERAENPAISTLLYIRQIRPAILPIVKQLKRAEISQKTTTLTASFSNHQIAEIVPV